MRRFVFFFQLLFAFYVVSGQETGTITDSRDGQTYNIVKIGNQWWMAENLNVGTYVVSIYTGSSHSDVSDNGTIEKYCPDNDESYCNTYGGHYDWNEMMQYYPSDSGYIGTIQGICPDDWHIPTDAELKTLEMHLGMSQADADNTFWRGTDEGGKMKETGTTYWNSPNTGATHSSGFTALPGGYSHPYVSIYNIATYKLHNNDYSLIIFD